MSNNLIKKPPRGPYPDFIGNHIASDLAKNPKLKVKSASINDPDQGLLTKALLECDVLVYWGHIRHDEISNEKSDEIANLIKNGDLAMLVLHSAHWATPMMAAMEAKAAQNAIESLSEESRSRAKVTFFGKRERIMPKRDNKLTLDSQYTQQKDGSIEIKLERPNCCFPACCHPVEYSKIRTLLPEHPIAANVPPLFVLPQTEMYDAPFHVPDPDELIFEETWEDGEHFRSGMAWNIGKGKVFYFRPGHETYPVFFDERVLKIIENATVWMGKHIQKNK